MTPPTQKVRLQMLVRDDHRCAACGAHLNLEAQHRQATGMGGRLRRPTFVELVTACTFCNAGFEAEHQGLALRHGLKVRRWVKDPGLVPVWYALEGSWFVLLADGRRMPTTPTVAVRMMAEVYGPEWEKAA